MFVNATQGEDEQWGAKDEVLLEKFRERYVLGKFKEICLYTGITHITHNN